MIETRKASERWKPSGAITIMDKDRVATIFLYTQSDGRPALVGYLGRKTRPDLHITRATQSEIESTARRWLDGIRRRKEETDRYRAARSRDPWDRNEVIARIRGALRGRGLAYSVTGGRGTAWGWIHIDLMPSDLKRLNETERRQAYRKLNEDFGISPRCFSIDGLSVAAARDYYQEYVERAEGRQPSVVGKPYWD